MNKNAEKTISLCMIAKNEADNLARCLDSVKDLVNEIIFVDTGSTDNTVQIARRYGAKVFHHIWTGNYSEARNAALKYANCDWVLFLDADEELVIGDEHLVMQTIKDDELDGIRCVIQSTSKHTSALTQSYFPRLFRNNRGIYYEGIVHERPVISGKTIASSIRIIHHGYALDDNRMADKLDTYIQLLRNQVKEDPSNPTIHFYLAKTFYVHKQNESALQEGSEVLRLLSEDVIKKRPELETYIILSCALFEMGRFQEAETMCLKAYELKPNYIDPPFFLGKMYFGTEKYEDAMLYLKKYFHTQHSIENNHDENGLVLHSLTGAHEAHFMLGSIYVKHKRYADATVEFKKAVYMDSEYTDAYNMLGKVYSVTGKYAEAISAFKEVIRIKPDCDVAYKNLAVTYAKQKEFTLADQAFKEALSIQGHS